MYPLFLSFFVLGLIIGSFLNVVVYRLKDAETILGRSFCRQCRHQIRWYDNIPVISFLLLRGRCRDCKENISWQYPALECLSGLLFAGVGQYFFSMEDMSTWFETGWLLIVVSCFLVIAAYDLKYMEIPIILLVISGIVTLLFFGIEFQNGDAFVISRLGSGLIGSGVVGAFFFALVFVSRETWMGWGDVWLGMVAGLMVGISSVLLMLTVSFALGAAIGIASISSSGKTLKSQIPFAPFLVIGTLFVVFISKIFPEYVSLFIL